MPRTFQIGDASIGSGEKTFIIAEAGVNHNGDLAMAKELIRQAKVVGADCVKFQTFIAERLVTRSAPKADYQLKTTDPGESQLAMLKALEMSYDAYEELIALARELGIVFLSTPYNPEDCDFLEAFGLPALKLASIHCVEPPMLEHAALKGKPLILSTGMADLGDVEQAVGVIRDAGCEDFVVLQCTTDYPSRIENTNLRAMGTMREALDVHVGYSDHTQGASACIAAVALGARVIEKHFTLDKSLPGPDQSSSSDVDEFRALVQAIRQTEAALGDGIKRPAAIEVENARGMRRSLVARRNILAGEILEQGMVGFMRPSTGVLPRDWSRVAGVKFARDVAAGEVIVWPDLGLEREER